VKKTVNVHEAKTHLSRLLSGVERGDEIVIARAGRPIARLLPFAEQAERPRFGLDKGRFKVPADFNAPLPDDVLADFEGEG
jgi:prevent-host-death family protein